MLEGEVDLVVGLRVVQVNSQSVQNAVFGEVVLVVGFWGWVVAWMPDVIDTAAAEGVVGALWKMSVVVSWLKIGMG